MKIIYTILFLFFLLNSCQEELAPVEVITEVLVPPVLLEEDDFKYDTLKGIYTSDFSGSTIRVILNYVGRSKVVGYNIHKGLQRNISGTLQKSNDTIYMTISEPGDHEFDGVFHLKFIGIDNEPTGIWICNDASIQPKQLNFTKSPPRNWNDSGDMSEGIFLNYFNFSRDTVGDYSFDDDGLVMYSYYPTSDNENRVEQLMTIKGNWSYDNESITIEWEKNDYFEERLELFNVIKEGDYEIHLVKNNSRTIEPYYY